MTNIFVSDIYCYLKNIHIFISAYYLASLYTEHVVYITFINNFVQQYLRKFDFKIFIKHILIIHPN